MEYNISEAELPTMVVRYENKLILRSIITGQHLEDLGAAPVWDELPDLAFIKKRSELLQAEHEQALVNLVKLYPCEELPFMWAQAQAQPVQTAPLVMQPTTATVAAVLQKFTQPQSDVKPPTINSTPLQPAASNSQQMLLNVAELPPCKVHRNYCCSYCNFSTQNPRSHLLHQRQIHGVRLSIHCCHHCQYASRYFQKLKRHVKMVHMASSPGKVRNYNSNKRASKAKLIKLQENVGHKAAAVEPTTTNQMPQKMPQKPAMQPTSLQPPANFKNPEAFFETAYRNQLIHATQALNSSHQAAALPTKETPTVIPAQQTVKSSTTPPNLALTNTNTTTTQIQGQLDMPAIFEKKRNYGCRKCSYVTDIKSRYNKHVKYHSMPLIQCDKCEFRTTYKWNLTRHLRSHHGNGLYKCSVCSFSAHMKQSLTSHELNHHSPPVGQQLTRKPNRPYRRRICRVGGSDLTENLLKSSPPITADDNSKEMAESELITPDPMSHESLKLFLKREAGTSSYSSSSQRDAFKTENFPEYILASADQAANLQKNYFHYTSSSSSSSMSSRSPSPTVSLLDYEESAENATPATHDLLNVHAQSLPLYPIKPLTPAQFSLSSCYSPWSEESSEPRSQLPPKPEPLAVTFSEQQQLLQQPTYLVGALSCVEDSYSDDSSDDGDDDDEDGDDGGDSLSTISANETISPGLHIAYDSSSPEHKTDLSESESASKFQAGHELDQQSNVFQTKCINF